MSPPPPSVSPLSNARTSVEISPSSNKMAALAPDNGALSQSRGRPLLDDDDKSSSLSEPDDDIEEEEDDDEEEDENDDKEQYGDQDDADDSLKPMRSRQYTTQSEDVDSEAETERLDQTPRKTRDGANGAGRTPSKLMAVEHADDELSDAPSPIPHDNGTASSTSTTTGKKRKRSEALESPVTSEESTNGESKRQKSEQLNEEDLIDDVPGEDALENADPSKSTKGKRGKPKRGGPGKLEVDAVESVEPSGAVEENKVEETVEAQAEDDPVRKSEAMDAFAQLAKQFTAFRDTLFNERLASIDAELALLEQPKCQHPEYQRMVACVEQRRVKQDREARAYHHYKQVAVRQRTLAERAQLHSQYFQSIREIREQALDELGAEWYAIHRERRQGVTNRPDDSAGLYQYVDKRSDQLRQQAKYNLEVSILSGFAKYVGFPAAPDISGVAGDALDADLRAMKLTRRAPQNNAQSHSNHQQHNQKEQQQQQQHNHTQNSYVPRPNEPSAASSERLAHEQFIEQHAWARAPQYSTHHTPLASTPNISHTPEWAEHTIGFRKPSNGVTKHNDDTTSQPARFATPTSSRAQREAANTHERDGVPQSGQVTGLTGSSPLQMSKQRLNASSDKDAWRNYSGTSTIDAPLGESNRDSDAVDGDLGSSSRTDGPQQSTEHTLSIPRLAEGIQSSSIGQSHPPPSLFADERPDVFRAAGFRPLDSTFAAATSGSMPSRT